MNPTDQATGSGDAAKRVIVETDDINLGQRLPIQTREVAPGIWWLSTCYAITLPGRSLVHGHASSVFLVVGADASILVDVGAIPFATEVAGAVEEIVGSRGLQYVFPTHLEHPHAGGLPVVAKAFPEATIVADTRDYHLTFPEYADRTKHVEVGDELDLGGGYRFTFVKAVLKDLVSTLWGYESSQEVMFVSDGFGCLHEPPEELDEGIHTPEECTAMLSELPSMPSVADAAIMNATAMWWAHHQPIGPLMAEFERLIERYPTQLLAPAHGFVIDDIEGYIPIMRKGCEIAYEEGTR
jgi:hypothetical protein